MKVKEFSNRENIYAERIDGSDKWFYCQLPNDIYPNDLLNENYKFEGTQLIILNLQGEMFEPIKREKNVCLSQPFYNVDENEFLVIRSDFNNQVIQLIKFSTTLNDATVIFETPLKNGGDMINLLVVINSNILAKYEDEKFKMLYPYKSSFILEENESVFAVNNNQFICSKWFENPEYNEEIIIRSIPDGKIIDRKSGYSEIMPNGELWLMTKWYLNYYNIVILYFNSI